MMGNPFGNSGNNIGGDAGNDNKRRRTDNGEGAPVGSTPATMTCTCQIMVDDNAAAKIIGSKGSVIKSIRAASGCQVNTDRQGDRADGNREIQVIGTLPGIQVALAMIQGQILQGDRA